jgi:hypothetical protein
LKEKKRPVWGSVGGFYKRFRQPAALPLTDLTDKRLLTFFFDYEYYIIDKVNGVLDGNYIASSG